MVVILSYPCVNQSCFSIINIYWRIRIYCRFWEEEEEKKQNLFFINSENEKTTLTSNTTFLLRTISIFYTTVFCNIDRIVISIFNIINRPKTSFGNIFFRFHRSSGCHESTFSIICKIGFRLLEITYFQRKKIVYRKYSHELLKLYHLVMFVDDRNPFCNYIV